MESNCDIQIIMLGESGVGKTSLLLRFISGKFREFLPRTTVDHSIKKMKVKDKEINLTVWDTAGQEMYHSLVRGYYRVADGVLLVYDVQNADTFLKLSKWLIDLKSVNERAEIIIAGNKIEDLSRKTVNVSMVKNFAQEEELEHLEVSAKSGENVDFIFRSLTEKILIAKGILPCSKDNLPTKIEIKPEENLSPVILDQKNSLEISDNCNTDNILPIVVPEKLEFQTEPNQGLVSLSATENVLPLYIKGPSDTDQLKELNTLDGLPLRKSGSPYHSAESLCSLTDTEYAECAMEFFDAFRENCSLPESNQEDVIKLHDERANCTKQQNKKSWCLV